MRGDLRIFLVFIIFLLSACDTETKSSNSETEIDLGFLKNQPPSQIYENSNFIVGLNIKNNFPQKIESLSLCVSDIVSNEHEGIMGLDCQNINIHSAQELDGQIYPEEQIIYFPSEGSYSYKNMDLGPDEITIFAQATYRLKTEFSLILCLKKDPTLEIDGVLCETSSVFDASDISNTPAPIVLDKVETTLTSEGTKNRVFLDFNFKKLGEGEVFFQDEGDNLVRFEISLGNKQVNFQCNSKNNDFLEFDQNSEIISCNTLIELNEQIEVNLLKVDLNYYHKVKITKGPISIKKLNSEET